MRIPQPLIDQILDRVDLVDLINSRVPLKKAGKSYTACCPFHGEKTPSFHVHRDKGFYHCFGCQASGNAVGFLMQYEHRSFIDAVQDLAQKAGVELPKPDPHAQSELLYQKSKKNKSALQTPPTGTPPQWMEVPFDDPTHDFSAPPSSLPAALDEPASEQGNLYDLLEDVALFYQQQLQQHLAARQYFNQRGVEADTVLSWRLGYAPDGWQHLSERFPDDIEGLKLLGLIRTSEQGRDFALLRDRVIFPIRDRKGRVVGFGGRAMSDEVKPKYINSPESVVFNKSQLLYGLYESRQARAKDWLMVEGYMDVIALHQAGLAGAVASLGTATNAQHLEQLFKQHHTVVLAFDGDEAGQRAAWRTLELSLPALHDGRELRFLVLPSDHDPDSLVRREGIHAFRNRLEQAPPLSDFLYATLSRQFDVNHPEGKSALMNAAQNLLSHLPQQGSYRHLLRQNLRERVGLGFAKKAKQNQDQLLSFERECSLEEQLILLLLHHPSLQQKAQILRSVCREEDDLAHCLDLLAASALERPDDTELALFFLLAAWPTEPYRQRLGELLTRLDQHFFDDHPDQLDGVCQELVDQVHELLLKRKLKTTQSLTDAKPLQEQLTKLRHRLHFRDVAQLQKH